VLWLLFKIQLTAAYRSILFFGNIKKKKSGPVKKILIAFLALYVCASLAFSSGALFYSMAQGLLQLGLGWVYFANIGLMTFGFCVIFTVFMSQSLLFEAKDNEQLLALPIRPAYILGSRLLVLALLDFVSSLLFLLPAGAIYAYLAKPTALFYILFCLQILLLPMLGLTVSGAFGYVISSITKRMRNKSFVVTFFSLALLALYLWGYLTLTTRINRLTENGAAIGEAIQKLLPPFYHFGRALVSGNLLSFLSFALWCLIPFAALCLLLSKYFISLATVKPQTKKAVYQEGKLEKNSAFQALLKKEIQKFINTPMYLLNSGMGFLLTIVFGVAFFIKGPDIIKTLFAAVPEFAGYVLPVVTVMLCFFAAMGFTTAPSISLEGKNLWILKSAPVHVRDIFHAKLSLNLIFGFVTLLFAGVCVIVKLKASVLDSLFILLIPLSVQLFTAQEGLIANLYYPKFDAVNEAVMVKQSASVMIATLVSFALLAVMITAFLLLQTLDISFALFGLCAVLVLNAANLLAYRILMTKGIKLFQAF